MKLIFVRHGHPDYKLDCLTELGHEQAEKASLRLINEEINEIYSSTCGRAYETALHTAEKLSLFVKQLEFMREIKWGYNGEPYKSGHPWHCAEEAIALGHSLMDESWTKEPPFAGNIAYSEAEKIASEGDKWLESLGYLREGANYRVVGDDTNKTVALFSHAGSSTLFLTHLFNLPFYFLFGTMPPDFTAITVIKLSDKKGEITAPRIELANDSRHIRSGELTYQM